MKDILITLCLNLLFIFCQQCLAQPVVLESLSYPDDGAAIRIKFNGSSPKNRLFFLQSPTRLVVDLSDTRLVGKLEQPGNGHSVIGQVRAAVRNGHDVRLVVDLKQESLLEEPLLYQTHEGSSELVVNMSQPAKEAVVPETDAWVVVIDAGHGGSDPGAHGLHGTQEKAVTLLIAKKLADLLNRHEGVKAILTREGDHFIALRKRMEIAREANADLFVSIHADAYQDKSVKGASVYTLSRHGASSEAARWLAEKENSADLLGGITLSDKDDDLATVLMDLSQNATLEHSSMVANEVLKSFGKISQLHKNSVQKAGFIVLKSPDIPSILVETAFISNPDEEKNLLSKRYQAKVAQAIYHGVINYLKQAGPVTSKMAAL